MMRRTQWLTLLVACTGTAIGACGDTRDVTGHETNPPPVDTMSTGGGGVDSGGPSGHPAVVTGATPVAIVDNSATVHVFSIFTGRLDGTLRRQLHFSNVPDAITGNDPSRRVTDEAIVGLSSPALSPDGQRLAFVASVAPGQSEIVVVGFDGTNAEVASPNTGLVVGGVTWSADGSKLAYGTASPADSTHAQLAITNLATHIVSRIPGPALSTPTAIRWAADGNTLVVAIRTGTTTAGATVNVLSSLIQVDVGTGTTNALAGGIIGEVTSISSTATRVLLTRTAGSDSGITTRLLEHTLAGSEHVVIDFDALGGHYVAAADELAVLKRRVATDGHSSVESLVKNVQTGLGLTVGFGETISVDATASSLPPGIRARRSVDDLESSQRDKPASLRRKHE